MISVVSLIIMILVLVLSGNIRDKKPSVIYLTKEDAEIFDLSGLEETKDDDFIL